VIGWVGKGGDGMDCERRKREDYAPFLERRERQTKKYDMHQ